VLLGYDADAVHTLDQFRLDGRRALVTGASRGLGREMALAFADVGADVVITGRTPETLERTADEIRARGRQAWTRVVDMGQPEACEAAWEFFGGIFKVLIPDNTSAIIATAASASTMPPACQRVTRSLRTNMARATVAAG
jgi:NAD(P)-dependent dehydrogenase (short-subunit alcohol dehydrogenase family)